MKSTLLPLAVLIVSATGCSTVQPPSSRLKIESILSVRHGAPDAQSYYQLGRYFQGQARLVTAEEAYLRAITIDDRHGDAFNALGALYAEKGDFERAQQMFRRALALAPSAAHLHNNLGYAYLLQGRYEDAYGELRQALHLDPASERTWANLQRIADAYGDVVLATTIRARNLEDMPDEFPALFTNEGSEPTAAEPETESNQPWAPPLAATAPIPAPTAASRSAWNVVPPGSTEGFRQISAVREVSSEGGMIALPPAVSDTPPSSAHSLSSPSLLTYSSDMPSPVESSPPTAPASAAGFRLEVSNGNGVSGFARKFSAWVAGTTMPVRRITNYDSYSLPRTVVEYQPGYESAARRFVGNFALSPALSPQFVAATKARPNSDVRLVLGRDALQVSIGALNTCCHLRAQQYWNSPSPAI